jgi:outer membrane protein assembly factor BamB
MLLALGAGAILALSAAGQPTGSAEHAAHASGTSHAKKCRKKTHRSAKRCRKRPAAPPAAGLALPDDLTPPGPPVLQATDPASPGSGNPRITGIAEPGSTVSIYRNGDCTDLAAVGTAEELGSSGIAVTVPPDSTTSFWANATDAQGRVGSCSSRLTYVEAPVHVEADPALTPGFDPNASDYATRCDGTNPVDVSVDVPHGASVSVDGSTPADGTYSVPVALQSGQEFTFAVTAATYSRTFHVRCLPSDFPTWTFDRLGQPDHELYAFTPGSSTSRWEVLVDQFGVPIWWFHPAVSSSDMKVLPDGNISFAHSNGTGEEIHSLDGALLRTVIFTGSGTDFHDMQQLPNGNLLIMSYRGRQHGDLTACGGSSDTTVFDGVVREIDPSDNVVHEWSSGNFVAPQETPTRWCSNVMPNGDIVHLNSIEPDGDALILSFRHLDAVYKIDRATGDVIWKLGGTTTSKSLTVLDDPYGSYPLGGQHDARVLPDGTITIHDNGTGLAGHPPRTVRYAIDEQAHTATLLESVSDPDVPASMCCGSARRSTDGAWTVNWGGNPVMTEFDAAGDRTFRLTITSGGFSYRGIPVPDGLVTAADLRAGMDAQYPRP